MIFTKYSIHTELSRTINNHVDLNFNYNVLITMTLSYTQVEEFNQIKIKLSCGYLCHSLIIVQTRYSLFQTNQQVYTCSLFQHETCYPKIESINHIQYNNDK